MKSQQLRFLPSLFIALLLSLSSCSGGTPKGVDSSHEGESPHVEDHSDLDMDATVDVDFIEVQSVNTLRNSFNELMVYGILENVGEATVGNLRVEIEFLDAAGSVIHQAVTYKAGYGLAPGEKIPFHYYSMETLPEQTDTRITIASLQPMVKDPANVVVKGATIRYLQSGFLQIVGEISNPNATPILIPEIEAALMDSEGAFLAAEECDICSRYLEPGEKGPFRVLLYGLPEKVASSDQFEIYAFAQASLSDDEIRLDWSPDQITFLDPLNWFHLVGEVENKGDVPINLHLLGTLYDTEGNVADVAARELIPHVVPPGERTGYDLKFWGPHVASEEIEEVGTWHIQVDRYRTQSTSIQPIELTTSGVEATYTPGKYEFIGKVINDSGNPVFSSTIVVLLRDRMSDQIVAMGGMDYLGPVEEVGVDFVITAFFPLTYNEGTLTYTIYASGN